MALAFLNYRGIKGTNQQFIADIGTNRFYQFRIGNHKRKIGGLEQIDEGLDDEAERPGDGIEDEGRMLVEQINTVADPLAERNLVVLEPFHALLLGPACRSTESRQRRTDLAGGALGRPACWEC